MHVSKNSADEHYNKKMILAVFVFIDRKCFPVSQLLKATHLGDIPTFGNENLSHSHIEMLAM